MNGRKRLLFVENPPFVGGSVTGLYDLVRRLDLDRYEPIMLFCGPNPYRQHFRQLGVRVETLSEEVPSIGQAKRDITGSLSRYSKVVGRSYWLLKDFYKFARRDYPVAQRVATLMREWGIDLVHQNNCLRLDRATILSARLAGVPQIVQIRNLRPFSMVERYLAPSVNAFIYVSRAVEKVYQELGIPAERGHVIYDGFEPLHVEADLCKLRREFGIAENDAVISNVGRIEWWKGHDYFVQSLAEVIKNFPNTKALIVGGVDPTMRNEQFHNRVQTMIHELGLSNHLIFTGFRSDVPQIMAMSNIVVHSSSEPEPFGRVIVEAMQVGRPVVATAAGGVLDIVDHNVTGLTVPLKDPAAMADAIQYLLRHPDEARAMGRRAQQEVGKRFSVEQHIHGVQSLYEEILDEVGSQRSYVRT
jgi:glycosyltransferase involved in cell wall biosynthesis